MFAEGACRGDDEKDEADEQDEELIALDGQPWRTGTIKFQSSPRDDHSEVCSKWWSLGTDLLVASVITTDP